MTFHTFPQVPFEFFEKESYFWNDHFDAGRNVITNLIRYCGYKTLHQDCFLYKWLQEQIRYFKFGGEAEMRKWITVPESCEFWQKLPAHKMRVSADQMRKWVELLHESHAILKEHCRGPSWTRFYVARPAAVAGLQGNGPPQSRPREVAWINKRSIHHPTTIHPTTTHPITLRQ
jgi:hypothetical protein